MTTIAYAGFVPGPGGLRPTRWTVNGADRGDDLDVTVESVTPGVVNTAELAPPTPHPVFAAQQPGGEDEVLQAGFPHGQIEVAAKVGYQDGVTLRTLLRKKTGRGVRELRGRP